jgi:UDP-N-acetylglucosamine 2-epimerase (hydrolysing)
MEALAGACVGMMNQILTAHIEGGEISGTLDETMRHSITKMANIHFVANDAAAKRVLQLGENPGTIFTIGSPEADLILSNELPSIYEVIDHYDIPFPTFGIVIFHPASKIPEEVRESAQILVAAIEKSIHNFLIILPNNDLHSDIIRSCYQTLRNLERVKFIPSMRFEFYLSALKHADFILGNSSSGVREAPLVGTPSLDLGERQLNRSSARSITHSEFDLEEIQNFIQNAKKNEAKPEMHFGDGKASKKFLEVLQADDFWNSKTTKQFNDLNK